MSNLPASVAMAVADPKVASTAALERTMSYVDYVKPAEFQLVAEEYARRGGEFLSISDVWEPPVYD